MRVRPLAVAFAIAFMGVSGFVHADAWGRGRGSSYVYFGLARIDAATAFVVASTSRYRATDAGWSAIPMPETAEQIASMGPIADAARRVCGR